MGFMLHMVAYYRPTRNKYSVLPKGNYTKNTMDLGNGSNLPYKAMEMRSS